MDLYDDMLIEYEHKSYSRYQMQAFKASVITNSLHLSVVAVRCTGASTIFSSREGLLPGHS